ncbi:TIGR02281 family clan AA aspartic protease [Aestuariivirga litoralis]|uniref:TIGR02281 family clan AA aspartic protease n=1 Tax=Aestuariivirga litoralis TaxID=2650924 RepID=UPI0018C743EB|nr:TIGR02281 family clan AA aspartic protease [Aestuariivirga litoralis]MBG1232290.1 TIGR02281 family clan AA aspartic protease [Aestuariivirga litoralis]
MRSIQPLPSVALAILLTLGAGLPGLRPPIHVKNNIDLMAVTEIKGGQGGHFVTQAYVNSQTIQVLVDTGASAVALSYEDADRVGLRPRLLTYDVGVNTANGATKAARVKLSRVEIDNVRVDNVDALVLPQGALTGTLLGMSFLSRLSSFGSENGTLTLKN